MYRMQILMASMVLLSPAVMAQEVHDVTVDDNFFSPQNLTITAGDSVRWTNQGSNPHNVVADDESFRCAEGCDSESAGAGDPSSSGWSVTRTFNEPGDFGYYCEVHGAPGVGMFGTITIEEADDPPPEPDFAINGGLSGSWYNPETVRQGFLFDFITTAEDPFLVAYWFTYDLDPGGPSAQRWLYGEGGYEEGSDTAVLQVYLITGGAFDQAEPDPGVESIGMAEVTFENCTDATFSYELDFDGDEEQFVSNSFDITALSPDIPENCEALAAEAAE